MKQGTSKLLKIGQLARKYDVLPSTIHFYTSCGLLPAHSRTQGGYRLYHEAVAIKRLEAIRQLQEKKRLSIEEIKKIFKRSKI